MKKIRKSDYLTMQVVAERLGCKPDAMAIIEKIERLKRRAAKVATSARLPPEQEYQWPEKGEAW